MYPIVRRYLQLQTWRGLLLHALLLLYLWLLLLDLVLLQPQPQPRGRAQRGRFLVHLHIEEHLPRHAPLPHAIALVCSKRILCLRYDEVHVVQVDLFPDVVIEHAVDQGRYVQGNALALERRDGRSDLEEVRVVAHFAQLHQDVDYAQKVATRQRFFRPKKSTRSQNLLHNRHYGLTSPSTYSHHRDTSASSTAYT